MKKDPLKRFFDKVNKTNTCWLWTGYTINGYGRFRTSNGRVFAHRFIWQIINGDIPKGLLICHKCDIRNCVNPEHLFLGTQKDNMEDCVNKNRIAKGDCNGSRIHPEKILKGENHPNSKLTNQQVLEIKQLSANGLSQPKIAKIFSVSHTAISYILNNKTYIGVIENDK